MACKKGQFDIVKLMVNNQFKAYSINLNTQHVNGMTPFDLALSMVIRYSSRIASMIVIQLSSFFKPRSRT